MKRFNSFYSLNVFSMQLKAWEYPEHNHNFYELILIESGVGSHILNGVIFPYLQNDVFLLTPEDSHYFNIEEETKFLFVKFTEQIFIEKLAGNRKNDWYTAIRKALQNPNLLPGNLVNDDDDRQNILCLAKMLRQEFTSKKHYHTEATLELFGAIMILVARNIDGALPYNSEAAEDRVAAILSYIRLHAFDKNRMRIQALAAEFYMSPNYISIYIRKHTGVSVQQLIMQTKLKAAEQLLSHGKMNINEIAAKLGFTDSSHFNKLFKKYKLVNPSNIRK